MVMVILVIDRITLVIWIVVLFNLAGVELEDEIVCLWSPFASGDSMLVSLSALHMPPSGGTYAEHGHKHA